MPTDEPPRKELVTPFESIRLDKTAFSVISLHDADADVKAYWKAQSTARTFGSTRINAPGRCMDTIQLPSELREFLRSLDDHHVEYRSSHQHPGASSRAGPGNHLAGGDGRSLAVSSGPQRVPVRHVPQRMDRRADARSGVDPAGLEADGHGKHRHLRGPVRLERRPFLGNFYLGNSASARRAGAGLKHEILPAWPASPTSPILTVAVPTCNGARHLAEALRSILAQEGVAFELLVSDDRSDDDTLEVVRAAAGDRVRIEVNSERLGLAGNWNRCVALARTPLVAIFHQDDVMLPGHLAGARGGFRVGRVGGPGRQCRDS